MGLGGIANEPTIPAYMASLADRAGLMADDGQSATIGADTSYFMTANADIMAGFSSQGPTDVDFRVKPDVVAPGVNVLSSIPRRFCDGRPTASRSSRARRWRRRTSPARPRSSARPTRLAGLGRPLGDRQHRGHRRGSRPRPTARRS